MKLLLAADLHVGRGSSRLPEDLHREVRAVGAWDRVVELAIQRRVGAVLLAGDVVDQDAAFFEAVGPLERGMGRLAEAGIRTLAVAGNHDVDVLPRLADELDPEAFTLLGRGGCWGRATLHDGKGQPALHVIGWSFPQRSGNRSPLDDALPPRDVEHPDLPTLGLVHGELDTPGGAYAPLALAQLEAAPVAGWLLGHIHKPMLRAGAVGGARPWVLYPGSVQALDPGEAGLHGVWLTEVDRDSVPAPEPVGLSSVRYDMCEVVLDEEADTLDAVESRVWAGVRDAGEQARREGGDSLHHVALRLRVTGRCPASVASRVGEVVTRAVESLQHASGSVALHIERTIIDVLPTIDLEARAQDIFAPGPLATLLLELREADGPASPEARALLERVRVQMAKAANHPDYAALADGARDTAASASPDDARDVLRQQATALLTHLVAQQEEAATRHEPAQA